MSTEQQDLQSLLQRLLRLEQKQEVLYTEVVSLKSDLQLLEEQLIVRQHDLITKEREELSETTIPPDSIAIEQPENPAAIFPALREIGNDKPSASRRADSLERFIGENLISKIGIAITVIGVAIGVKYSIDHNLISPIMRVVLAYAAGVILLLTGMRLKEKYTAYSAVLVSGALSVLYFTTFWAYATYALMPMAVAFLLMTVFTAFTVFAALQYDKVVIAHLGLVGAYGVPFLLSNGSGRVELLYSYMMLVNSGILAISFRKYWPSLLYHAFVLSWLIYMVSSFIGGKQSLSVMLGFASALFLLFYISFLAYKIRTNQIFRVKEILFFVINSFIYYTIGLALIAGQQNGSLYLGLFTVANALIHFVVAVPIYRRKQTDDNVFFLIAGLVLTFITIAIPVQLRGDWVPLLWCAEATVLYVISRKKDAIMLEWFAYPLQVLCALTLFASWERTSEIVHYSNDFQPFIHKGFYVNLFFIAGFGWSSTLSLQPHKAASGAIMTICKVMNYIIPAIFLIVLYNSFRLEIDYYWISKIARLERVLDRPSQQLGDFTSFRFLWELVYSLIFIIIAAIAVKRLRLPLWSIFLTLSGQLTILVVLLSAGLYRLSLVRFSWQHPVAGEPAPGAMYLVIRYLIIGLAALVLIQMRQISKKIFRELIHHFTLLFVHLCIICILSSELIHLLTIGYVRATDKLALSILWGCYALMLIVLGIRECKQIIRIAAIVLFTATLGKVFFYDLSNLSTIAKTIVFVSLGVLLLIVSFLYNKYKAQIANESEDLPPVVNNTADRPFEE